MFYIVVVRTAPPILIGWVELDARKLKSEDLHQYFLTWVADEVADEVAVSLF
jgi:hypothetical protein